MRVVVALAACAALLLSAASCADRSPPNVLLLVVDTLRADRLGVYGNRRGLTPFLDSLAERGTVFVHAYAASSWTIPSVASLMTSRYSSQHHVITFGSRIADSELTFAEAMQPLGYTAGGFSANVQLLQRLGFAQGFQGWLPLERSRHVPTAAELRRQGLEWLDGAWQAGSRRPAMLYFQFMEPHGPYDPPEPYRSRFLDGADPAALTLALVQKQQTAGQAAITREDLRGWELLYDGEVATVDAEIKILFDELERRGFLDDAIVVVTADHGEEFWEHSGLQHGRTLYDESVRVPLIVVAPGYRGRQRVTERVSLIDVGPTLLELLHLPPQARFEGRSLVPMLQPASLRARLAGWFADPPAPRQADVVLELRPKTGALMDNRLHVEGIVRDDSKLLVERDGASRTYDLTQDPGELMPDPPQLAPAAKDLAAALAARNASSSASAGDAAPIETIDEATKEQLRALGYEL